MKKPHAYLPLLLAVSSFLGSLPTASALEVQTLWSLSPGDRPYLTTSNHQRGMAYNPITNHLLVVDAAGSQPATINILDANTGADVGSLSTLGVSGGHSTFDLIKIAVTDDGRIFACALTTDSASTGFRLYQWANEEADPVLVFDGDPSLNDPTAANRRFGDNLVVRGTGSETRIILRPKGPSSSKRRGSRQMAPLRNTISMDDKCTSARMA